MASKSKRHIKSRTTKRKKTNKRYTKFGRSQKRLHCRRTKTMKRMRGG